MAKYRAGDKVRVRADLKALKCYGGLYTVPRMEPCAGSVLTILSCSRDGCYKVRENKFYWGDEMLEPLPIAESVPEISPETERVIDDPVEHPVHYTSGEIECITAIEASMSPEEFRGFLKGTAMKYMWRYDKKGKAKQDLEKSRWYINRLWSKVAKGDEL